MNTRTIGTVCRAEARPSVPSKFLVCSFADNLKKQ
eukprot:COSAG02_NODE_68067_length_251_cov_0.940789_1_plen_34_part_01